MPISIEENQPYSLGFTAASLRPELARIMAEAFLDCGDWKQTRERILAENALQATASSSAGRMEREIRPRLQTLTQRQIEILANAPADSRRAVAWLSVLKHTPFVFAFSSEVLRGKIEALDPVLRPSDYEGFVVSQSVLNPELSELRPSTLAKLRRVLMAMLREMGILGQGKDFTLMRPIVPPDVLSAILEDDRRWLAGFLVPDDEIAALRE